MNARLVGVCLLVALAVSVVSCGSGATATVAPAATSSPASVGTTATPVTVATQALAAATATTTPAAPTAVATALATAAATMAAPVAPTVTATATAAPPTATATTVAATATTAPAAAATKPVDASNASLTVNGQAISYSYPNGWQLKQVTKDTYSLVSLEGPNGALLTLTMYGMDADPAQLSATLLETMKKQCGGATVTALTGTAGGIAADGYTMKFTYTATPMTATILSFRGGKSSFTLYTQAADADLGAVQPGFDLIKNTLVVK